MKIPKQFDIPTSLGNCSKDSQYLNRIKRAIEGQKEHPRHHGVLMQAHHAISGEGMKGSGLGHQISEFEYDINLLPNLAFIPCTLQGACYLGVQPHRGNHTAHVDQDDYTDDDEPRDYHEMVSYRIKKLELPLSNECVGDHKEKCEKVKKRLDKLSGDIFNLIQNKPKSAPLTKIANHFNLNNPIGCGGMDSIPFHSGSSSCPVERNHHEKQATGQSNENITYISDGKYKLIAGR